MKISSAKLEGENFSNMTLIGYLIKVQNIPKKEILLNSMYN